MVPLFVNVPPLRSQFTVVLTTVEHPEDIVKFVAFVVETILIPPANVPAQVKTVVPPKLPLNIVVPPDMPLRVPLTVRLPESVTVVLVPSVTVVPVATVKAAPVVRVTRFGALRELPYVIVPPTIMEVKGVVL